MTVLLAGAAVMLLRSGKISGSEDSRLRVPIIMYHSISADESRLGEFTVSPQLFEEDIIFLKQQGFEAITVNDLIMHVRYGTKLPQKPVIITLDDGHLNALTRALPIIQRHGFKMTVSCVGKWSMAAGEAASPDENFSYCDAQDIARLRESGAVEIGCHSYNMHSTDGRRGILRLPEESEEQYRAALLSDIFKAQSFFDDCCSFRPNIYTYPYGFHDKLSDEIVKSAGFEATLTCEDGINIISGEQSLYGLKRFDRPYGSSSEEYFSKILE